ncbi:hypothetical protein DNTS_002492 [Danionella cerebrum]|uniref:Metalloendopeptidase n=1 Tax=Danionella cerebrum TaxID=2873325 RepID=A0A553PXK1_9TELE|nr:hypothetical protein DNTS_002492 [Danionella translucida]
MDLFVILLCFLMSPALIQSRPIEDFGENFSGKTGIIIDDGIVPPFNDTKTPEDIAFSRGVKNADPCTARGCKWNRSRDRLVYVPYVISRGYAPSEKQVIERALQSFSTVSCIRFVPHNGQRDFLNIQSQSGCYSYLGRQGGGQVVSLDRFGCIFHKTVQHELLHALGFHHEQNRSDRDKHIQILYQNIIPAMAYNFDKQNTNNLGTPYDYNSVMHYPRQVFAFSSNNLPTMVPIPNSNVRIGEAQSMSPNDILRVNRLYCSMFNFF